MKRLLITLVISLGLPLPWTWAETTLSTTTPVDAGQLTNELKAQVKEVDGIAVDTLSQPGQVLVTIQGKAFTEAEVKKLEQALANHQPIDHVQELKIKQAQAFSRLKAKGYTQTDLDDLKLLLRGD